MPSTEISINWFWTGVCLLAAAGVWTYHVIALRRARKRWLRSVFGSRED